MWLSPGEARREGKAGEAAFRGKACLLFAPEPEGGAGLQEITRRVGGAWAEPWTAAGSCDESVSCKVLPARQNFASTQAAASPSGGGGEEEGERGPQTRHAEPARLPKAPPLLGNRALLCD